MSETIRTVVLQIAHDITSYELGLHAEQVEMEKKLGELREKRRLAESTLARVKSFRLKVAGRAQCPRCWIKDKISADVVRVSDERGDDALQCDYCKTRFALPSDPHTAEDT